MKQKKLIFNFFVNRNWKKLTDSRKRAKILADNRKSHHPIETLENLHSPSAGDLQAFPVLPTFRVDYNAGKPIESVAYWIWIGW